MKKFCAVLVLCFLANISLQAQSATEQQDSFIVVVDDNPETEVVEEIDSVKPHNPTKAVWFSAVCPGLGQTYNRKYWKVPIIYGAFMGLTYGIMWNNQYYKDYKEGYLDFLNGKPNPTWQDIIITGKEDDATHLAWVQKVLKQKRERYRRWRDMCIIGMFGVYALNIIDAFVDAQLMDFDISQDLSLTVAPSVMPTCDTGKTSYGLQFNLHF